MKNPNHGISAQSKTQGDFGQQLHFSLSDTGRFGWGGGGGGAEVMASFLVTVALDV